MTSIFPSLHIDGRPTLRDSDLLHLYDRMDAEGLAVAAGRTQPGGRYV